MKLTILGAGCWGATLAWLLTDNFEEICLWSRKEDLVEDLLKNKHCSKPYVPTWLYYKRRKKYSKTSRY